MEFPLSTARLTLAPLDTGDIAAFVAYRRDPGTAAWQSWSTDYSEQQARDLVEAQRGWQLPPAGEWLQIALHDRMTGALRGDVALHRIADQPDTYELGFTLAPDARKHGLATEAVTAVVAGLFDSAGAHRVTASCDERNTASAALLLRAGFRLESTERDADWFKGEWTTLLGFARLASEHENSPAATPRAAISPAATPPAAPNPAATPPPATPTPRAGDREDASGRQTGA